MSIGITGASGNLGRKTADLLLDQVDPSKLVLITRDPAELAPYAARGAQVRFGDFDRPDSLPAAFDGVDRLLLISATDLGRRVAQHIAAIDAARAAGVRHIVYTSGINPTTSNSAAVAPDHRATEEAVRASGLAWTILRNSYYADQSVASIMASLPSRRHVHNAGDGACAYVARDDCAAAAAAVLSSGGHAGQTYDVTGPDLLTTDQMVRIVSDLTGTPLEAVAVDDATFVAGLVERAGMPPEVAETVASFGRSVREGALAEQTDTVERLTGRPAIRFEELVRAALAVSV